ncbi:MAG: permease prefix domain 1-containing protein [Eubacteriales bacterium]|nr:permease prefix domain 1-containing protein [Eubacteriales bacterium]
MREQLIQYVSLLFAGAEDCEDTKQEILQNTLDRYDDLIAEGKAPEAAYRLAITGIGDINEILGRNDTVLTAVPEARKTTDNDTPTKKLLRAIAVGLYILCPLPLIVLSEMGMDTFGLCGLLCFVAVATVLIILGSKKGDAPSRTEKDVEDEPKSELGKSVSSLIWAVGLAVYLILSFLTGAWHVTWVIFPILGAVNALVCSLIPAENPGAVQRNRRLKKSINSMIWTIGLALYFIISFATMAWYITWLVFPITGAVQGLTRAILDLKEAVNDET